MRRNFLGKLFKPLEYGEEAFPINESFRDGCGGVMRRVSQVITNVREVGDMETVQFIHELI